MTRSSGGARVRRATTADAATLARLLVDFNTEFDSPVEPLPVLTERCARLLELPEVVAVLAETDDGEPTGFAFGVARPAVWFDGPVAHLDELYVVPELRGRGIGSLLLAESCRLFAAAGAPELHIGVDEVDADTRRFYEQHGFVNVEEGTDYRMLYYLGPTA